jgi:hypothetical protein
MNKQSSSIDLQDSEKLIQHLLHVSNFSSCLTSGTYYAMSQLTEYSWLNSIAAKHANQLSKNIYGNADATKRSSKRLQHFTQFTASENNEKNANETLLFHCEIDMIDLEEKILWYVFCADEISDDSILASVLSSILFMKSQTSSSSFKTCLYNITDHSKTEVIVSDPSALWNTVRGQLDMENSSSTQSKKTRQDDNVLWLQTALKFE